MHYWADPADPGQVVLEAGFKLTMGHTGPSAPKLLTLLAFHGYSFLGTEEQPRVLDTVTGLMSGPVLCLCIGTT